MCFLIFSTVTQAISVEDFSRHLQYSDIKISPDGEHLAALVKINGLQTLAFIETKSGEITHTISADRKNQPGEYYWVNNERVVIQVEQLRGSLEAPLSYGELYAVNYDGTKKKMVYGYRSKAGVAYSGYAGFLIDILPDDKKHVLIRAQQLSYNSATLPKVVKLNVYNGKEKRVKKAPIPYSQFLIDDKGVPRFVTGIDKNYKTKLFYSKARGEKWQRFGEEFEGEFTPLLFAENSDSIYALKTEQGKTQGLYKYNLETKKETLLYRSEFVDPTSILRSGLNHVFGLRIDEDYPSYIYLDENNEDAQLHKALYGAFKGDSIAITSKTTDEKKNHC